MNASQLSRKLAVLGIAATALIGTASAQPQNVQAIDYWLETNRRILSAMKSRDLHATMWASGLIATHECSSTRCIYVVDRPLNSTESPDINSWGFKFTLYTTNYDQSKENILAVHLSLYGGPCLTMNQLSDSLKLRFYRVGEVVAHCVPEFFCKNQPIIYRTDLPHDEYEEKSTIRMTANTKNSGACVESVYFEYGRKP